MDAYTDCNGCRYKHMRFIRKRTSSGYLVDVKDGYGCHFLPYWGKKIDTISKCPKYDDKGNEKEWSLKSVCHVNTEV